MNSNGQKQCQAGTSHVMDNGTFETDIGKVECHFTAEMRQHIPLWWTGKWWLASSSHGFKSEHLKIFIDTYHAPCLIQLVEDHMSVVLSKETYLWTYHHLSVFPLHRVSQPTSSVYWGWDEQDNCQVECKWMSAKCNWWTSEPATASRLSDVLAPGSIPQKSYCSMNCHKVNAGYERKVSKHKVYHSLLHMVLCNHRLVRVPMLTPVHHHKNIYDWHSIKTDGSSRFLMGHGVMG